MGASGWQYFTRYRPDPEDALQELRNRVFDNREFLRAPVAPWVGAHGLTFAMRMAIGVARFIFWLQRRRLARARSIEEALNLAGENGTHSILDVERTAKARGIGVAAPAPGRWLQEIYGTQEPTRELVERHTGELDERLERGEAVYVLVYRDGEPDEIYFEGHSGD
jgi:hypothetical protein